MSLITVLGNNKYQHYSECDFLHTSAKWYLIYYTECREIIDSLGECICCRMSCPLMKVCIPGDDVSYNFPGVLGPTAHLSPIESGHRPKSIACMQRSGSNSSLKNSVLHSVNDPRYHSIAALPPRMEIPDLFNPMMEERGAPPRPIRGGLQRGPTLPDEQPDFPSDELTVLPSDPDYRKVAQNLMTCSPQPRLGDDGRHQSLDLYTEASKKSPDELAEDISSASRAVPSTSSPGMHTFIKGQDIRQQIHSPSESMISLHSV